MNMQPFYDRMSAISQALNIFRSKKRDIETRLRSIEEQAHQIKDQKDINAIKHTIDTL